MPDEGVDIRIRTRGAREAAADTKKVSDNINRLGRGARRSTGDIRLFSRATTSASGGMRVMGGAALYGGAAMGGILFLGIKKSTEAWAESRKIAAQTGAVLKSTGGAANVTAGQVSNLATSLSRKTGIDDEQIQSGENLLLTFRNIRNESGAGNDVFNQTTGLLLDMSTAMHQDVKSSAIQMGKALNDPVKGMTALQRVGVAFTKGQKDQIAAMVASGDRLGAQKIILRELAAEFGGSAAAAATPMDRLKVSIGNVQEAIGHGLQPVTDSVAKKLDKLASGAAPKLDALGQRLGKLANDKNLTTDQKITLGFQDVQRTLRPYERELGNALSRMDLGDKLGKAFEAAAPRIADAAGRAAPRAAGAFVNAFINAGPYGQLFTLGLLGAKLGVFSTIGKLAAGKFGGGFGGGGVGKLALASRGATPANPVWVATGTGNLPTPTSAPGKGGRFGKWLAGAAGAAAGAAKTVAGKALPFAKVAGGVGAFVTGSGLAGGPFGSDAGLSPDQERRNLDAYRRKGMTGTKNPRTRPSSANPFAITVLSQLNVDGKKMAQAVARHAQDEKARGR